MKKLLKKLVQDTPFEQPARNLYFKITKDRNYVYDQQTFSVMKLILKKNSNCIDVGAHKGDILKKILEFSPLGKHIAFEPLPQFYKELLEKFPSVKIYDYALSNTEEKSSFNFVKNSPGFSGLKKRKYDIANPIITKINVKTKTLDKILEKTQQRIDFIKIDVEGAERLVMEGALKTIQQNRPYIVFEYGLGAPDYDTTPEKIYKLINLECGLKISLLDDWIKGKIPLTLNDFKKQFYNKINWYFLAHPE